MWLCTKNIYSRLLQKWLTTPLGFATARLKTIAVKFSFFVENIFF